MGKVLHPLSDAWNFADELCDAVQARQEHLQVVKEELAKRDRQIDKACETAAAANACCLEESLAN